MNAPTYSSCGKQVLRDGAHWADCAGPAEAAALAEVLSVGQVFLPGLPVERLREIEEVLWG